MLKLPDPEQFSYKDCVIANDECWLIAPKHIGVVWSDENAHFRSIIVRKSDNHIVSLGLKKFTNMGETPEFQPWNSDWKFDAYSKLDGSLLICSKYKGEIIARTRGTVDARSLPNGYEIDSLIAKYPQIFNNPYINSENWSILCEWTTPNNVIILREHDEPTLTLIGMIRHDNLKYMPQRLLDSIGQRWDINRPKKYEYNSIMECILDVDTWRDREGVVIYASDDCAKVWDDNQTLKKIKASLYLQMHRLASGIRNINHVVDLFINTEKFTKYEDFYNFVKDTMDFEIAERIKDDMLKIINAYNKVLDKQKKVNHVIDGIRGDSFTRKDQAMCITQNWHDWRRPYAFGLLDNKLIDDKMLKIAIESELA